MAWVLIYTPRMVKKRLILMAYMLLLSLMGCSGQPMAKDVIGRWQLGLDAGFMIYTYNFKRDYTATTSLMSVKRASRRTPAPAERNVIEEQPLGQWAISPGGKIVITITNGQVLTASLNGNLMIIDEGWVPGAIAMLVRLDSGGQPMPIPIAASYLPSPLFDVKKIRQVEVHEYWTGLSPIAPIEARYRLGRNEGSFTGDVEFSVRRTGDPFTRTAQIMVPPQELDTFLTGLASTPVQEGLYAPFIMMTDDYPRMTITVTLPSEVVVFHTESQGTSHIPWKAVIKGKDYVVFGGSIAMSWNALDRYLARDTQNALLIEKAP